MKHDLIPRVVHCLVAGNLCRNRCWMGLQCRRDYAVGGAPLRVSEQDGPPSKALVGSITPRRGMQESARSRTTSILCPKRLAQILLTGDINQCQQDNSHHSQIVAALQANTRWHLCHTSRRVGCATQHEGRMSWKPCPSSLPYHVLYKVRFGTVENTFVTMGEQGGNTVQHPQN